MFKQVRFTIVTLIAILAMGVNQAFANGTLVEGLYFIFDEGSKTATVTYPGPTAPAAAGDNSYTGAIEVPAEVYHDGYLYNVTKIGDQAFRYSTVTSLTLNEGLLSLGVSSLNNMTEITELVFPNSMTSNGSGDPLCGCSKLKSISFGTGFTSHGQGTCHSGSPVTDVYFNSTTPPTGRGAYFLSGCSDATIHVPETAVAVYQSAYPSIGWGTTPNIVGDISTPLTWADFLATLKAYKDKGYKSGTAPNEFPAGTTDAYDAAITAAEALTELASDTEMKAALAAISTAIDGIAAATPNALTEGFYYIRSNYEAYKGKYGVYPAMFTSSYKTSTGEYSVYYNKFDAANPNFIYKLTAQDGTDDYFYAQNVATGLYLNTGDGDDWYNEYTTSSQTAINAQWFRPYGTGTGEYWIADDTDEMVSRAISSAASLKQQGMVFGWTVFTDVVPAAQKGYNTWTLIPITETGVDAIKTAYQAVEAAKDEAQVQGVAAIRAVKDKYMVIKRNVAPYNKLPEAVTTEFLAAWENLYNLTDGPKEATIPEEITNAIAALQSATEAVENALAGGGCWEYAEAATAPAAGKNYAVKNVTQANYFTTNGIEKTVSPFNADGVWTLEATGEQEDGLDTYYLKSVGKGLYVKKEDWANAPEGYDGFDIHAYAGFNADLTDNTEEAVKVTVAACGSTNDWRSADGGETGYIIATAYDEKQLRLGQQGGTDVTFEPYTDALAWEFYEATYNNDINAELAAAIEVYNIDVENAKIGDNPGFYNTEKVAAYTTALNAAKALNAESAGIAKREAIDNLKAAYEAACVVNPLVDGFYYIVNATPLFEQKVGVKKAMCVEDGGTNLCWETLNKINKNQVFEIKSLPSGNFVMKNYGTNAYVTASTKADRSQPILVTMNEADAVEQKIYLYEKDHAGAFAIHNTFCDIDYHPESNSSGEGVRGKIVTWAASWSDASQWYLYKVEESDWEALTQADLAQDVKALIEVANKRVSDFSNLALVEEDMMVESDASNLSTNAQSLDLAKLVNGNLSETTETWSKYPHNDAYLQVDLADKVVTNFYITIAPRTGPQYKNDTPVKWIVTGSDDGSSWEYVDQRLTNADELAEGQRYVYDPITLTKPYKYLRFTSPVAISNRTGYKSHFALGEFQLYNAKVASPIAPEYGSALNDLLEAIYFATSDINEGFLTTESAPDLQAAINKFDAAIEEANTTGGVWQYAEAATAPEAGKNYAVKNVTQANYFTTNGIEKTASPFNADGVWTLEATGEQEDGLDTYYLKSVGKGLYVKKEDWANAPEGYDGFDIHAYAGFNADLTDNTEEAVKVTVAACGSTNDWRSADGGETGYIIATAYDEKQLRLGQQGGTDVTFEPYTDALAWEFYKATYNNDINAELAAAIQTCNLDVENIQIGDNPGFYDTEKVAAYTAALEAAKALNEESTKVAKRAAIDNLKAAYETACEVNPLVEGLYYIVNASTDFDQTGVKKAMCVEENGETLRWGTLNKVDKKQVFEFKALDNGNFIIKNYGTGAYVTAPATASTSQPVLISMNEADAVEQVVSLYENVYPGAFAIHNTFCNIDYHPEGNSSGAGRQGKIVTWYASWSTTSQWYIYKADMAAIEQAELGEEVKALVEEATTKLAKALNYIGTNADEAIIESDASNLSTNAASLDLAKLVNGNLSETTETWSNYPHSDAYLQVDLTGKNVSSFYITLAPRADNGYRTDTPLKWIITGSKDGENWEYIDQRTTNADKLAKDQLYTYEPVLLDASYKHLRFTSPVAISNRTGYTTHFALGEFQLYTAQGGVPAEELEDAIGIFEPAIVQAIKDIKAGTLTAESAPALQAALDNFDAFMEEYNRPAGVWEYGDGPIPTTPGAGRTYAIKNVAQNNYLTTNGVEATLSPLNADGAWTLEATGEQEDGLDTYYLKSVGKGLYVKKEDWANAPEGYDGFDIHAYAGFNADFTDNKAEAVKVTVAECGTTTDWRSADGGEMGYIIATAYDGKQLRLGQQRGTDVTFEPYTDNLAWWFCQASFNNDIQAELAAALEAYNFDVANAVVGENPGYHNSEKIAAYTTAREAANAMTAENTKIEIHRAIDNLKAAYEAASEVNPIVEGYYYIASAGKGSGYPASDVVNYDEEERFALYNENGLVKWKMYDESLYDEIYYFSPADDGTWFVKSLTDATYMNRGTGTYSCNIITSTEPEVSQLFEPSVVIGKWTARFNGNPYVYALTASHNGSKGEQTGTLNIWGSSSEANSCKMNLWYVIPVSEANVTAAKESLAAGLDALIAEIEAEDLQGSDKPGYYSVANIEALNTAIEAGKTAADTDAKFEAVSNIKKAYNKATTEFNPITDGYYYLVNKNQTYANNFGAPAAMYTAPKSVTASGASSVRFEKFDENNPNFIFKLTAKDGSAVNFYAQNAYTEYYLNTGDGDTWYGELTTCTPDAVNAQVFQNYGLGQYWVADETDTRVSRVIRLAPKNGTVYGWTQFSDNVTGENVGYNAWELIPVSEAKVQELVASKQAADVAAAAALNLLKDDLNTNKETIEGYLAEGSEVAEGLKAALQEAYDAANLAVTNQPIDITSTADDYAALQQALNAAIEAAGETPIVRDYWQIAEEPSVPEAGKFYVLKNAYNSKFLDAVNGTAESVNVISDQQVWGLSEFENEGTFALYSVQQESYFQYVDYASQQWEDGTPFDGYDWFGYIGMNATFGDAETAQEFTILPAVAGNDDIPNSTGKDEAKGYVLTAAEKVLTSYYKLGVQGTNAALEPWNEDVAWEFYEVTPVEDAHTLCSIALVNYGNLNMIGGTAPGYYDMASVEAYELAKEAVQNALGTSAEADVLRGAAEALIDAAENCTINPIVDGYYFIVTAGKGTGYPVSYESLIDREEQAAMFNEGGFVKWGPYDDTATKYVYQLTASVAGDADYPDTGWSVKNIADNSYIGTCLGDYGIDVATTEGLVNTQAFIWLKEGKWAMKSNACDYVYAMKANHNGSDDPMGNLSVWGTSAEALTYGINQWFLIPCSEEMIEKITAVGGITADDTIANGDIYTIDGKKVAEPVKGQIYIINGKKVRY